MERTIQRTRVSEYDQVNLKTSCCDDQDSSGSYFATPSTLKGKKIGLTGPKVEDSSAVKGFDIGCQVDFDAVQEKESARQIGILRGEIEILTKEKDDQEKFLDAAVGG